MKSSPFLLGTAALLVPATTSAQDCKVCVPDHGDVAELGGAWGATLTAATANGTVEAVATLTITRQEGRRVEGELCVGREEATTCAALQGTISEAGEVTLVGTGKSGFVAELDLSDDGEDLRGRLSFHSPKEWFAEQALHSPAEYFAECYRL